MNPDDYLPWLLATTPAAVRSWLGDGALGATLADDFAATIASRVHSDERLQAYAACCPVPGAAPRDYALREIALSFDLRVLAGIHFRNLVLARPFVGVYAQSRDVSSAELPALVARLAEEFAVFAPLHVWFWALQPDELLAAPGAALDRHLVVGRLQELVETGAAALPDAITLERDETGASYDDYRRSFDAFVAAHPHAADDIACTDRSDYEDCASDGALYTIQSGATRIGVIAARPGRLRGIVGWEMVDEILDAGFRGRGLAPPLQRAFLERLDSQRHPLVFGTIAADNLPSLRTALRVGRRIVGGWVFVPVLGRSDVTVG